MGKNVSRNLNIDLLRILATCGVIVLHMNSFSNGGVLVTSNVLNSNLVFAYIEESMFLCAVNVFLLISGYFSVDHNNIRISKALKLIFEVVFLSELVYILDSILSGVHINLCQLLLNIIPQNYYVTLYIALYLFTPYINKMVTFISEKRKILHFTVLYSSIFIIWPFIVSLLEKYIGISLVGGSTIGINGDQAGYTIVNFIGMYLMGAFIKKSDFKIKSRYINFILLVGGWILLTIWRMCEDFCGIKSVSSNYNNPLVVIIAILTFVLFLNLNINSKKVICFLAKISFIVYLIQGYFIKILNSYVIWENQSLLSLVLIEITSIFMIWLLAIPIYYGFEMIFLVMKKSYFYKKTD